MMEQNKQNRKVMLSIVGIAILVIGLIGVTYAFFNYTRTGTANAIKTGRIYFNSEQGTAINLTNMFPIDVTNGIPNDNTKVGTVTINVTGDTTYDEGIEYLVSAVNVQNTIGSGANAKSLPISIDVSVTNNTTNSPATTLGTSDDSYFDNRGGNSSIYKVLSNETINNNDQLLVGYITKGSTGIDGNIVIKAYLDKAKIAITDTYDGNETDNMGTTSEWVDERVTFTTQEWNSLQANGVSFQIKVESNEGIWVEEPPVPLPTMDEMCPNCKFMFPTSTYRYGGVNNSNATSVSSLTGVTNDYHSLNKSYFIGFTETQNGKIDRAFVCGIMGANLNDGTAFCLEGSLNGSTYVANKAILNALYEPYDMSTGLGCDDMGSKIMCFDYDGAYADSSGGTSVGNCTIDVDYIECQ